MNNVNTKNIQSASKGALASQKQEKEIRTKEINSLLRKFSWEKSEEKK